MYGSGGWGFKSIWELEALGLTLKSLNAIQNMNLSLLLVVYFNF